MELLSTRQAADMLHVSRKTLHEYVRSGELASIPKGHGVKRPRLLIAKDDVQSFLNNRRKIRPCPSINEKPAHSMNTTFNIEVVDFAEIRAKLQDEKRKSLKKPESLKQKRK